MREAKRACASRYGACDIDSMPPPTPTSTSPARIAWSRITLARRPLAQTLLTVSEETSLGIPALIWAWREGIWPCPACRTWPITTCWTCSGSTLARSSAALIARPPSSVASTEARPPPILPIGVRAVPRMTVLGMARILCSRPHGRHHHDRPRRRDPRGHRRRRPLHRQGGGTRRRRRRAAGARGRRRGQAVAAPSRPRARRRAAVDPRRAGAARGVRPRARTDRRRGGRGPGTRARDARAVLGGPPPQRRPRGRRPRRGHRPGGVPLRPLQASRRRRRRGRR